MTGFSPPDEGIPVIETRGRKPGKKAYLLHTGLIAKRAGSLTYIAAVETIYPEYSKDLPKVSGDQEKRRKTDIAALIRNIDEITPD